MALGESGAVVAPRVECRGRVAGDCGDFTVVDLALLNDDAMVGLVSRSVTRMDEVRRGGTGASLSSW